MSAWTGSGCPFCASAGVTVTDEGARDPVSYRSFEGPEGNQIWQRAECEACGAKWNEVYGLSHAERLTEDGDLTDEVVVATDSFRAFVESCADMWKENDIRIYEGGEREEYEMENDDAWETINGVIHDARKLLGLPETREEEV